MTPAELRAVLQERGCRLYIHHGQLKVAAPGGAFTPDLARELARHSRALLELVRAFPCQCECWHDPVTASATPRCQCERRAS